MRLIETLRRQPHLFDPVFYYFSRYSTISTNISRSLLNLLKNESVYAAFTAAGLRALRGRCHKDVLRDLEGFARSLIDSAGDNLNPELHAAAASLLLVTGALTWPDILKHVTQREDWWLRSELIQYVQIDRIGTPSYQAITNNLLRDTSVDVSIVAAHSLAANGLIVQCQVSQINPVAQLLLKQTGLIGARRPRSCSVSAAMQQLLGVTVKNINWKTVLGPHYNALVPKSAILRAYAETDATAWVNLLDTIHDDLLDSLFARASGALGTYNHGRIGGLLGSPSSKFATNYPQAFKSFSLIHEKRLESALSHSITRQTKKPTRFIEHSFINKSKPQLRRAYLEIWRKWP
jgi:hypothetical protein